MQSPLLVSTSKFLRSYGKYILLFALLYMPLFGNLDILAIRDYDEGRITANAAEMFENGDYIVTRFNTEPEMWNTKPPLLIWCQVFLMHIVGINEIAIRLPTSFSAFFTCLAILIFCARVLKEKWLGIIIVLSLVCSDSYIANHVARTGDYDTMLILFTFTSTLLFFCYTETQQTKFLYYFFLCLAGSVLTKGVAGLLFTPALILYALLTKQVLPILKNRHFYFGLLLFAVLSVAYYLIRETQNPGYIAQVRENEWGGRYLVSQGHQEQDFWLYYKLLVEKQMADRYLLIPLGLMIGLFSSNPRIRRFSGLCVLSALVFFLIISGAKTRLPWYTAPLFPFIAVFVGLFIWQVFHLLADLPKERVGLVRNILPCLLLVLVFFTPYRTVWNKTYFPSEEWDNGFYELSYFLKDAIRNHIELNGTKLVYDGHDAHVQFYQHALKAKGQVVEKTYTQFLKPGDRVIAYQKETVEPIQNNFVYEEKPLRGQVRLYTILAVCDSLGRDAQR